jgi:Integrase zinc binding domain
VHHPGKLNKADTLSRPPGVDEGKHDNENTLVLPDKLFAWATEVSNLEQQVWDWQARTPDYFAELHRSYPLDSVNHHWVHQGRPVVADQGDLKQQILHEYHDHALAGHPGIATTLQKVSEDYWWPMMWQYVQNYVKGCATCQMTKPHTVKPKPPLMPVTVERKAIPFQTISLDLITDLPVSRGYDSILTVVDHDCSKAAFFLPCQKTIDAEEVAQLYVEHIFPLFGCPHHIISDRDPHFTAHFTRQMCELLGVTQNISSTYHPQTDGQSERANQWVEQYLQIYGSSQ